MTSLPIIWFVLIAVLIAAYAVLDGFDLGAGFWSLFAKDDAERGAPVAAIGPFWDGNEVWLLTGGGAIFAAFPEAYATIFSGFYFAFIIVILAFIFRAVAIEFRGKYDVPAWRRFWELAFGIGSTILPIIFGVAVGNLLRGIPLDAAKNYTGGFFDLLNPYALFAGVVVLVLFAAHGAAWLALKGAGDAAACSGRRATIGAIVGAVFLAAFFAATALLLPERTAKFAEHLDLLIIPAVAIGAAFLAAVLSRRGHRLGAFLAQGAAIASGVAFVAVALFPLVVPASNNAALSLTIVNAASTPLTQKAMLVIAAIGMPFVILYHVWIYRVFAGRGEMTMAGTASIGIRTLSGVSRDAIHRAWAKAFDDYQVRITLSEAMLFTCLRQNGVDFDISVGAFDGAELVGFWLNAIREIRGCRFAYDSGTAIHPAYRGRGLSKRLAEASSRILKDRGVSEYVLEVLVKNEKACDLYLRDGFIVSRRFHCYRGAAPVVGAGVAPEGIVIQEGSFDPAMVPQLPAMEYEPSWQNTTASMMGIQEAIHAVVARAGDRVAGYGLIHAERGRITQIGIAAEWWETALPAVVLARLCAQSACDAVEAVNVDAGAKRTARLFLQNGFELFVEQYEMTKHL